MAPVALAFAVLDLTGSRSDLGFVLAARTVPQVVFILVGGVIADRLPRNGSWSGRTSPAWRHRERLPHSCSPAGPSFGW
jgi:hypothetical protein